MTALVRLFAALLVALPLLHPAAAAAADADVRRTWQMLDYLGVDYAGAVKDGGQVASASEFDEMREFARGARARIAALPPVPEQAALQREAEALAAAIESRAAPARVAALAHGLGDHLLAAYPVPLAPAQAPDAARGAAVYQSTCAACHGATGHGDGAVGVTLDPHPVAFADAARARQRSVFALYQAVSQGIPGTAMPAFAQLPEADRWAVATYVGRFAHDDAQVAAGQALWASDAAVRDAIGGLDGFVRTTEASLATTLGAERAGAVLAYLHTQPQALAATPAAGGGLGLARERLRASAAAQAAGDAAKAGELALSSYLDGVEPWEQALAARDAPLKDAIETGMSRYRALLAAGAPPAQVGAQAAAVDALLARGDLALAQSAGGASAAFFGSFAILLREGLEALLVVVAMIAFLRKAQRRDVLAWVHAGWVSALAAGALTWVAATWLVRISGANREVTEGLSSLFAALVLLGVGVWMHRKSVAGHWQAYLRERMAAALTRRSALFMAGLAFLAVYREVFETILFYAALWGQGHDGAIVGGLATASACLGAIAVLLLRFSARLPIGQFFAWSSWLVAVLAVVLTGKGIAALQEAGWIAPGAWSSPRVEILGIYPSAIGLVAQGVVLATVLLFFLRKAGRPSPR